MNSLVETVMFPLSNKFAKKADRLEDYIYCRSVSHKQSSMVILYAHGNGVTLEKMQIIMEQLARDTSIDVLAFEYPGYGRCVGLTTPETVKNAALRAYKVLLEKYMYHPDNIVLMGRSIGTGPILWLMNHIETYKALVLISAFTSVKDLIGHHNVCGLQHLASWLYTETFNNLFFIEECRQPVLFIHGQDDEVIPLDMCLELHEACQSEEKTLCVLAGGTHNYLVWDTKEIGIFIKNNLL